MVGRNPALRESTLLAKGDSPPVDAAFMRPASGEREDIKISVIQMDADRKGRGQVYGHFPGIFDACTAANCVSVFKNRVGKHDLQIQNRVMAEDF